MTARPTGSTVGQRAPLARILASYWLAIAPTTQRELRGWRRRAERIPDPVLRDHALDKLEEERLNPEAAAAFATISDRSMRRAVARVAVAFQVLYDYLDALSEQPVKQPVDNGLALHRALEQAVADTTADQRDHYALHPQANDGGYVDALVAACQSGLQALPSFDAVAPVLASAAARCGEAQARTNAVPSEGVAQLAWWSQSGAKRTGLAWWEYAAGAAACLSVHALIGAAGDRSVTQQDATDVERAYHPWVCALTTFLDSLVDLEIDEQAVDHSYLRYYATPAEAARRVSAIAFAAQTAVRELPRWRAHAVIVEGIVGFYLSKRDATAGQAADITERLLQEVGGTVRPIIAVIRLRRRLRRSSC